MSETEKAIELFEKLNCAQSVLGACGPHYGLSDEMCMDLAGAFGGGMGRMGEVCGTVTAALMVMGLRNGQEMANTPAPAPGALNAQASALMKTFKERHGSLLCRELTGCNMSTAEGMEQFKNRDLKHTLCNRFISSSIELLQS